MFNEWFTVNILDHNEMKIHPINTLNLPNHIYMSIKHDIVLPKSNIIRP